MITHYLRRHVELYGRVFEEVNAVVDVQVDVGRVVDGGQVQGAVVGAGESPCVAVHCKQSKVKWVCK